VGGLSSGAAQAREKAAKRHYCARPDEEPRNTGKPKWGFHVQHAINATDLIVIYALRAVQKPTEMQDGQLQTHCSITKIVKATAKFTHDKREIPRRTVCHSLHRLQKKGIIRRWDESAPIKSPFGISWFMPRWQLVTAAWANNPEIGTVGRRGFYVQGKGRKFLTPADLIRWKIDDAIAAVTPAAYAQAPGMLESPASAHTPRLTPAEQSAQDVAIILRAILDEGVPATEKFAAELVALARQTDPSIPAEAIGKLIHQMTVDRYDKARAKRDPRPVLNVGWYRTGIAAAVKLWRHDLDKATAATRAG
jgi:hypothetical protein